MSSAELVPLFPSATHPAIPIAARILSTLRNLTAPGKGNDMKPEERAALVGISALLGCERCVYPHLPVPIEAQALADRHSGSRAKTCPNRPRRKHRPSLLPISDRPSRAPEGFWLRFNSTRPARAQVQVDHRAGDRRGRVLLRDKD